MEESVALVSIYHLDELTPYALIALGTASAVFLSEILTLVTFASILALYIILKYDSRLFVGTAIFMLILSAVLLASGNSNMANGTAIIAYYFLVVGVLGLMIQYVRDSRNQKNQQRPQKTQ